MKEVEEVRGRGEEDIKSEREVGCADTKGMGSTELAGGCWQPELSPSPVVGQLQGCKQGISCPEPQLPLQGN